MPPLWRTKSYPRMPTTSASYSKKEAGSFLTSEPVEPTPLVIVEGFLGGAGAVLWGDFEEHINLDCRVSREHRRRVIFARYVD